MPLDLSATTTKLLRKLAATKQSGYVQLKRETGGGADPITGDWTDGVTELIGINAAVVSMPVTMVDGTRILSTDSLVVTDKETETQTDDRLLIGGVEHTMFSIDVKNHAGTVQAQFLGARK